MTRPILAIDKAVLLLRASDIARRLEVAIDIARAYHRNNPANTDAMPALLNQLDELCEELAQVRVEMENARS